MKTTLDIQDELIKRAEKHAKRTGQTLSGVVEEGLRLVLSEKAPGDYKLPDCSIGDPGAVDPLKAYTWQDLRRESYGEGH